MGETGDWWVVREGFLERPHWDNGTTPDLVLERVPNARHGASEARLRSPWHNRDGQPSKRVDFGVFERVGEDVDLEPLDRVGEPKGPCFGQSAKSIGVIEQFGSAHTVVRLHCWRVWRGRQQIGINCRDRARVSLDVAVVFDPAPACGAHPRGLGGVAQQLGDAAGQIAR